MNDQKLIGTLIGATAMAIVVMIIIIVVNPYGETNFLVAENKQLNDRITELEEIKLTPAQQCYKRFGNTYWRADNKDTILDAYPEILGCQNLLTESKIKNYEIPNPNDG